MDDGRSHRLANVHDALPEADGSGRAAFQHPRHVEHLCDGVLRAVEGTTTAAVAQFRENQHFLSHDGDGVELTHLGAASAGGTFVLIYLGDEDAHLFPMFHRGVEKEGRVLLFHVAV